MRYEGRVAGRKAKGNSDTFSCLHFPPAARLMPHALFWMLLGAISIGTTGCSRETPAAPRYTVQIERLLPLHPLWRQVQAFDTVRESLITAQITQPVMEWESRPLLPLIAVPDVIPADLARERQKRIEADARRYVQQLEEFLNQRAQDVLTRVERSERKAMEARLAEELEKRIAQMREANQKAADELLKERHLAEFRDVAFQSQMRTFKGQALLDAQIQHRLLDTRIAALNKQRDTLLADVRPQAVRDIEPRRKQALSDLQEEMRRRRADSEQAIAVALDQARERLRAEAEAIPPLEQVAQSLDLPKAVPVPAPVAPDPKAFEPARARVETAQTQQRTDRDGQRERRLAAIREDTRNAVLQIAQKEGWQLAEPGTRGAADHTDAVANALKSQWKPITP